MTWDIKSQFDRADGYAESMSAQITGVNATYHHVAGGQCVVRVVVTDGVEVFGFESGVPEFRQVAELLKSQVDDPQRGDRIVCGESTLTVQDVVEDQSDEQVMMVTVS